MPITGGQLTRYASLLAKIESSYGSDSTPAATDAILVLGEVSPGLELEVNKLESLSGQGVNSPAKIGANFRKLSFSAPLKGSGTAGTAPRIGALIQACGFKETIVPVTSVTYTIDLSVKKSVTIKYYEDGMLFTATGCVGTFSIEGGAGKVPVIKFDMSGLLVAAADSAIVAPTHEATEGLPQFGGCTLASNALISEKWSIASNSQIAARKSVPAASGYQGFIVTKVAPTFNLTAEMEKVANYSAESIVLASTVGALSLTEGVATNLWTITSGKFVAESFGYGSNNGVRTMDLAGELHDNAAAGDALTIAFT